MQNSRSLSWNEVFSVEALAAAPVLTRLLTDTDWSDVRQRRIAVIDAYNFAEAALPTALSSTARTGGVYGAFVRLGVRRGADQVMLRLAIATRHLVTHKTASEVAEVVARCACASFLSVVCLAKLQTIHRPNVAAFACVIPAGALSDLVRVRHADSLGVWFDTHRRLVELKQYADRELSLTFCWSAVVAGQLPLSEVVELLERRLEQGARGMRDPSLSWMPMIVESPSDRDGIQGRPTHGLVLASQRTLPSKNSNAHVAIYVDAGQEELAITRSVALLGRLSPGGLIDAFDEEEMDPQATREMDTYGESAPKGENVLPMSTKSNSMSHEGEHRGSETRVQSPWPRRIQNVLLASASVTVGLFVTAVVVGAMGVQREWPQTSNFASGSFSDAIALARTPGGAELAVLRPDFTVDTYDVERLASRPIRSFRFQQDIAPSATVALNASALTIAWSEFESAIIHVSSHDGLDRMIRSGHQYSHALSFIRDDLLMCVGTLEVELWDLGRDVLLRRFTAPASYTRGGDLHGIGSATASRDGSFLAYSLLGEGGESGLWVVDGSDHRHHLSDLNDDGEYLAFSPDSSMLARHRHSSLEIFDTTSFDRVLLLQQMSLPEGHRFLGPPAFDEDGDVLRGVILSGDLARIYSVALRTLEMHVDGQLPCMLPWERRNPAAVYFASPTSGTLTQPARYGQLALACSWNELKPSIFQLRLQDP